MVKVVHHPRSLPKWYGGSLPHTVEILVPSTKRGDVKISPKEFKKRVRETERFLIKEFQGETTLPASGVYYSSKKHKFIKERIGVVEAHAKLRDISRHRAEIKAFVKRERQKWGQESVGLVVDGRFFFGT